MNQKNVLYLIVLILLTIVIFQFFYPNDNTLDSKLEKLHKENDSLICNINKNKEQIKKYDSLVNIYSTKIEQDKAKLDSLKFLADKNKQKYNEERNRINTLSNKSVASEFTNTFN